jgi:hypothetical protein
MAPADHQAKVNALIQLEVACRIALDALPVLEGETVQKLRDHIQALCDVSGAELDRISPGWRTAIGRPPQRS